MLCKETLNRNMLYGILFYNKTLYREILHRKMKNTKGCTTNFIQENKCTGPVNENPFPEDFIWRDHITQLIPREVARAKRRCAVIVGFRIRKQRRATFIRNSAWQSFGARLGRGRTLLNVLESSYACHPEP